MARTQTKYGSRDAGAAAAAESDKYDYVFDTQIDFVRDLASQMPGDNSRSPRRRPTLAREQVQTLAEVRRTLPIFAYRERAGAGDSRLPGADHRRRDRLGQDDADHAVLARGGLHQGRRLAQDRLHAAAPRRRDVGGEARRRRDGRQARQRSRLLDSLRGRDERAHHHQVHDRRHAAARVSRRARPGVVLVSNGRRGARAHAAHRHSLWPRQGHCALPTRPQARHLVGDARGREV
jgi:hypothetical protein